MKICLIDVDGHNFPNLAMMKLSAYHKSIGDSVEFNSIGTFDKIYMSKVFTFTEYYSGMAFAPEIIKGGSGYNYDIKLNNDIEHICPDYSLYNVKEAYGFLTRGCIRKCSWCIVPSKEGELKEHSDIDEFLDNRKEAILLDNNPLAIDHGLKQIEKIIDKKIKIDFNQGLDARIIAENKDIAKLLSRCKWLKPLRMACDTLSQMPYIERATKLLREYGCTPANYFIYVLVKDIDDALERVEFLRGLKLDPFAQPFRNFKNNEVNQDAKRFSRWVNHKAIFKTVKYENYK